MASRVVASGTLLKTSRFTDERQRAIEDLRKALLIDRNYAYALHQLQKLGATAGATPAPSFSLDVP